MATIQISSEKKFVEAIGILLDVGGLFWAKPTRRLVVGYTQLQALRAAGLVPKRNGVKKRGQKKA